MKNKQLKKGDKVRIVDFGNANTNSFTLHKVYTLAKDLNKENGFRVVKDDEGDTNGWSNAFSLGMKFEPVNDFPEKWVIKQRLSEEVCDWWNKKFSKSSFIRGNYGYLTSNGGYRDYIPEGYTEITLEQFNKYILNKEETMKTYKVTREQMQEIYYIACYAWKTKILQLTQEYLGMFNTEGEIPEDVVQSMRDAATSDQLPVINRIFPEPKKLVKKEVVAWINVYKDSLSIYRQTGDFYYKGKDESGNANGRIYDSKEEADKCAYVGRIACVELTGTYEIEE